MTASTLPNASAGRSVFARYGWPIGIAAVLLLSAGSNILVMVIAKRDPAFAVEPDYYKKAIEWDASMAQERANASLRWDVSAQLVTASTATSPGTISVAIADASGQPVSRAQVTIEAMHNARAADRLQAALHETTVGMYTGSLEARRVGEWEVRVIAEQGGRRFTKSLRVTGAPQSKP